MVNVSESRMFVREARRRRTPGARLSPAAASLQGVGSRNTRAAFRGRCCCGWGQPRAGATGAPPSMAGPRGSVRVAVGMALVPSPGGGHDVFELRVFGLPTQFMHRPVRRGHESGRVAGPARLLDRRNRLAGYPLAGADDFPHRVAVAVAEVVEAAPAWGEAEEMRLRQVEDMNIIPDAGAIGRGIIRAINFAVRLLSERHLQDVWDKMRLDAVMLAESFAGAGGVEVAERDELQSVNPLIPLQHLLEHQLGLAIRVDGALRQVLGHRQAVGRPVGRARRAEHELLHTASDRCIEQLQAVADRSEEHTSEL